MWVFILFTAVSAKVALGAVDCSVDPDLRCEYPVMFGRIPVTVQEFEELCPVIPEYIKCTSEYELTCHPDNNLNVFKQEAYIRIHDLATELCFNESLLHRAVTENLQCFNETFKNISCVRNARRVIDHYRESRRIFSLPDRIRCLQDVSMATCVVNGISKNCSSAAKNAAVEIIQRAYSVQIFCNAENVKELLDEIDDFQLNEESKQLLIIALRKLNQTESNGPISFL